MGRTTVRDGRPRNDERPGRNLLVLAAFAVAFATTVAGCSEDPAATPQLAPPSEDTTFPEPTLAPTTRQSQYEEGAQGPGANGEDLRLRVEGDPGVRYAGRCISGEEESELDGHTPRVYSFPSGSGQISCRLQKVGSEGGALRAVLVVGNSTRSVQQTTNPKSVIEVSYSGTGGS